MGRNLDPKCKQERREGVRLYLKGEKSYSSKNPMVKRDYPPGMHGPTAAKTRSRLSGYGKQLREKQKAKKMYRLLEKQFKNYYLQASRLSGDTVENLLRLLEKRLDNVVYRLGFAVSRDTARQIVNHGHILVNGHKVTIPSYQVKIGQEIRVAPALLNKPYWQTQLQKMAKQEVPGWLSLKLEECAGQVVSNLNKSDLAIPFDPTLIIEFYSR